MEELGKKDFVVHEGNNRHEALMRKMESLIKRNKGFTDLEDIKYYARDWNNKHCRPPLDNTEFEKQWKCAIKFIEGKSAGRNLFCQTTAATFRT